MLTDLAPPIASHIDLRAIAPYMPLDVVRLRDSRIAVEASAEAFRAAVMLWCVAWHQVPAASLPDDERLLARYAGVHLLAWRGIREEALHGFVRCSDGRLYHHVIAEKAVEVWDKVCRNRKQTRAASEAAAAKRRANVARTSTKPDSDPPPIARGSESGSRGDLRALPQINRGSSERDNHEKPNGINGGSIRHGDDDGPRNDLRNVSPGEERRGEESKNSKNSKNQNPNTRTFSLAARAGLANGKGSGDRSWAALRLQITEAFENVNSTTLPDTNWVETWRAKSYDAGVCLAVVREGLARKPEVGSLKYFDRALEEQHGKITEAQRQADGTKTDWDLIMRGYVKCGAWAPGFGPFPGMGGCRVPREILSRHMPDKFPPLQS